MKNEKLKQKKKKILLLLFLFLPQQRYRFLCIFPCVEYLFSWCLYLHFLAKNLF